MPYHSIGSLGHSLHTTTKGNMTKRQDRQNEQESSSFTRDLRALHDISMELSVAEDVQDLCRRAVILGRETLGFDRLGIWFIDPENPAWNVGTWGTDEQGNVRDERESRVRRNPDITPEEFYTGKVPMLLFENAVCYNDKREPVGRSDKVLAPLWDGNHIIGELSADNLLTGRAFDAERQEVLIVFARIIAHLSSLKRVESELRRLASTDSLTGAINRRTALIILEKQIAACLRKKSPLTVAAVDLDTLKLANDRFGHAEGDSYIRDVFRAMIDRVRVSDTVGRIGGDEFLVIFPDCEAEEAKGIMQEISASIEEAPKEFQYSRAISCGIASLTELPEDECNFAQEIRRCTTSLLSLADDRMYTEKRQKPHARE